MGLGGKLLQIIALPGVIIIFAIVAAAAAAAATTAILPKTDCLRKCGNVEIPFPFGSTEGCSLDESFNITCASGEPMKGNIPVRNISIDTHEMHVMNWVARDCYKKYDVAGDSRAYTNSPWLWFSQYTISNSKNKFTVIGCDTIAYLSGYQNGEGFKIGCSSQCPTPNNVVSGSCSGVGCCEVGFPDGLNNISVEVSSFNKYSNVWDFNPCGYAFVVEKGQFNFSAGYLKNYPNDTVPLVIEWAVGNLTCEEARSKSNFACKENSECLDRQTKQAGYRCTCKQGYKGNPYLLQGQGGCQDIDECEHPTLNNCTNYCFNGIGNYTCGCPQWYHGDGRKDGEGCSLDLAPVIKVSIGVGIGLIAMLGGSSWLFLVFQKRNYIKHRAMFFRENGGAMLQQHLGELGTNKMAKLFTAEELKVATNNYNESRIIDKRGSGLVYKGFLPNNTIVVITKSKIVDPDQVHQFIKEIVVLSQIDHKNVVKLLGSCLETQAPLLVYEFVSRGTLYNYIHSESSFFIKRWETYLKIAAETANALSYLHSLAIIHRDVKSFNILLDDNFIAKVSNFGISKLAPHYEKDEAIGQENCGYLDPEYFQTRLLTEKSDVYSFGVVLVELLTGEDIFSFNRPEDRRYLPRYFLSFLEEGCLDKILEKLIVEEGNKEQINRVVRLAERCLKVAGGERPSMMELFMELEQIRMIDTFVG